RRRASATRAATDIWYEPAPLPCPDRVAPASDPTALLRSLGEPPFTGTTDVALRLAIVIERAAALASALALSADLLVDGDR
ncbi:MAG TPA: hypothetical protein VE487_18410, partial [Ilumatobacter sp.]|nr:hypothetical protein [Ilumatobacter sp.]